MLGSVYLGKSHVNDWLFEVHDGPAELGLAREGDRCAILNLDEEVGDSRADLGAADDDLEVNKVAGGDLTC